MIIYDQDMHYSSGWRNLLLTVHIITSVSLIGTDLVLLALGISGAGGADPQTIYPAAHLVGTWLVAPLALVALGTGLLQGLLSQWGLVKYWWVVIKLAITVLLILAIFFVLLPSLGDAADAASGVTSDPLTGKERTRTAIAPAVAVALLAINVGMAVYKPDWRLRSNPNS